MTSKKISKEHLQNLLYSFERNENLNSYLMIYTYLNISFLIYVFIGIGLYPIALITIFLIGTMIITTIVFTKKFSLHLNNKKNKKIIRKLKQFLITGKMDKDEKFKEILGRLKLTELQYRISLLVYFSYIILLFSIEILILSLPNKIFALINPLDYNIIVLGILYLIELSINILMLIFQTLRNLSFKSIRQLRVFLNEIRNKELTKIEDRIEKIMDLKLKRLKFNRKRLLRYIQRWNDIYLGSYFIGLRKQLLILDYNNFVYDMGNEVYYYRLFSDLKFKIEQANLSNSLNRDKNQKQSVDSICNFIEINVKMLDTSIKSRLLVKNERRTKIRMSQTWIGIISITLSIIFSLSNISSLIGL